MALSDGSYYAPASSDPDAWNDVGVGSVELKADGADIETKGYYRAKNVYFWIPTKGLPDRFAPVITQGQVQCNPPGEHPPRRVVANVVVQVTAPVGERSTAQVVQDAEQVAQEAAKVAQDAAKVAQDAIKVVQELQSVYNSSPTSYPGVDERLQPLLERLKSSAPDQVELFQQAQQEIQVLQGQESQVLAALRNRQSMLSANGVSAHLSTDASDALFLLQQSLQKMQQSLDTASTLLGQYATAQVQSYTLDGVSIPRSELQLQAQAKLVEFYGQGGLALGNLARTLEQTQLATSNGQRTQSAVKPADFASGISQGLEILKFVAPILEFLPLLF
jgi:hypothetical protein